MNVITSIQAVLIADLLPEKYFNDRPINRQKPDCCLMNAQWLFIINNWDNKSHGRRNQSNREPKMRFQPQFYLGNTSPRGGRFSSETKTICRPAAQRIYRPHNYKDAASNPRTVTIHETVHYQITIWPILQPVLFAAWRRLSWYRWSFINPAGEATRL